MTEEEQTTFFGYHVVCLIDVLGQKQRLADWPRLPQGGQPRDEFVKAIKQTAGTVLSFREHFIEFFEVTSKCTMPERLAALSKDQQEWYRKVKQRRVRVERFSDTFVFSSLILNPHGFVSVIPVYDVLLSCCMAMLVSLAAKVPVRGAVAVGTGAELEDGSFYGPPLAEAHYLEAEVAGYPRVVVSPTVLEFIAPGVIYSSDRLIGSLMSALAGTCRGLITQDVDGLPIVDFLGKRTRELLASDDALYTTAVRNAYEFVRSEAARFRKDGDSKLALRYHLLEKYIEPRLPFWEARPAST